MLLSTRTAGLRSVTQYEVDKDGLPRVSLLEILRYRRFIDLATATAEVGCGRKSLRDWELRRVIPSRKNQEKLQVIFGRPWSALRRTAPRYGIPRKEQAQQ